MTPPHRSILTFEYDDAERARRVERSIRPELGAIDGDRTTAALARDGPTLELTVAADDLVALRAGCNTWLTLSGVAEVALPTAAAEQADEGTERGGREFPNSN